MAIIQQNDDINAMEVEQMRSMREIVISQLDDEILPFLEGIENITDPTEIFCKNIERYGYKSIIFVPTYNKIRREIVYEPWYALKQLGIYLHHSEPDKLGTGTLKNHITKSYKKIEEELATGSRVGSEIIVPKTLQIKELGQVNFTNFEGAKYLVNQIATDSRYKNNSGRPIAKEMVKCLEQVSIISRDLLIVLNRIVAEYHQKVRNGEIPSVKERKIADAICVSINPNMSVIQKNKDIDTMEVEQERTMREWMVGQLDDDYLPYVQGCSRPWVRTELLLNFIHKCQFKDILMVPYIVRNKQKYSQWYCLSTMATMLGRRVDALKIQLLKDYAILTIPELEKQLPQIVGAEIIVPEHLNDNNKNTRKYINHKALLVLLRDIAYKNREVIVDDVDVRPKAKEMFKAFDSLDELIGELVDDLNKIVAEYRYIDQVRELEERIKQQKEMEQKNIDEKERLRVERIDLAIKSYPDKILSKTHKVYIFSSPEYLDKMVPQVKVGITDDLPKRLKQHQTSCPTGKMYYSVDTYDSKGAEQALLHMYRTYGLAIKDRNSSAEEWIKIASLEKTKERLKSVTDHRNGEYEDLSGECQLIREMVVGEEEPFIVNGQNYIEYKEPPRESDIEIPEKEFIQKICEKIGINDDNKVITYKTALLSTMREVKKDEHFKPVKSKLPIDIDSFLGMNIEGISIKKEIKGHKIQITIEMTNN